jgi:2-dehydro-3-deoxyphosphooctonate aldolase (KDO 8-P synthase)
LSAFEVLGQRISRDKLFVIAGPCVIEDEISALAAARFMSETCRRLGIPYVYKSSYDKANRTSIESYRGPGIERGLEILSRVRHEAGVPVLTDVHSAAEALQVAEVVDILQIPAFLARQTDLLLAAGRTGKPLNIKKSQFLAPWDMSQVISKVQRTGNDNLLLTERGTSFGYNNLVVDMRSIPIMSEWGYPVVFDATHSVQLPGGLGGSSGGQRQFVAPLACAAVAAGAHGIFIEVHENPDRALCDGPNSLALRNVPPLLEVLSGLYRQVRQAGGEGVK